MKKSSIHRSCTPATQESDAPQAASEATPAPAPLDLTGSVRALGQRALEIYTRAQQALRRGDWAGYGAEQKQLEETLRTLGTPP